MSEKPTDAAAARERLAALAPSHRREHASWVGDAERNGTRVRRAAQAVRMLHEKETK